MVLRSSRSLLVALFFCAAIPALAQSAPVSQSPAVETPDTSATLATSTAMRDAFIARIHALGYTCPIAPPRVVVEDVPSFGQYVSETNTLRTSDWSVANPQEKTLFFRLSGAGPGSPPDEARARALFDVTTHQWVFIHELGHWWQHCTGITPSLSHYQIEYGANRISLAYWREVDPGVAQTMLPLFQGTLDHSPNPVPAGQSVEGYFNKNYETLGPSPAYPWFMSRMNVAAYEEKPTPTLAAALASMKK